MTVYARSLTPTATLYVGDDPAELARVVRKLNPDLSPGEPRRLPPEVTALVVHVLSYAAVPGLAVTLLLGFDRRDTSRGVLYRRALADFVGEAGPVDVSRCSELEEKVP